MTRRRHFRTTVFLVLALVFGLARAEVVAINPDINAEYVVKKGDTLWDISAYYLENPWEWPQIWQVNQQIRNPHLIYPGDVLVLTFINGKPVLRFREDVVEGRLKPEVRRRNLSDAVPPIPLDAIRAFLNGPRVIDNSTWKAAPYIVAFSDDRILGLEGEPVYVRNLKKEETPYWRVFHKGQLVRDPDSGRKLGYECTPVGSLELENFADPATGSAVDVTRELLRGDRLFLDGATPLPGSFAPAAPDEAITGRVAAVYDGRIAAGRFQIVAINRGQKNGLAPGHVLSVHQDGAVAIDAERTLFREVKLPSRNIGKIMLFDVTAELAYGLVMEAQRDIRAGDHLTEPRS